MDGCVMGLHFVQQLDIANKLRALQSKEINDPDADLDRGGGGDCRNRSAPLRGYQRYGRY